MEKQTKKLIIVSFVKILLLNGEDSAWQKWYKEGCDH